MSGNLWQTPDWFIARVLAVAVIAYDPCTTKANPVGAKRFTTPEADPCGLFSDWSLLSNGGLIYCNPPYGRGEMAAWSAKIIAEAARGCEIIALVRNDASTRWARELIKASRLIAYPPRIKFKGATGSANFSNAIHYLGPRPQTFRRAFADLGPIVVPITKPTTKKDKRS